MNPLFLVQLSWLPDYPWLVPVIGGTACVAALMVGWRVLHGRAAPAKEAPDLDVFQGSSPSERRAVPRRKGNCVVVEVTTAKEGPVWEALVLDRSMGGLRLLSDQSAPVGSVLRVRPRNATQVPRVEVTVRGCRPDGNQFELGCQFHQTPAWNVLVLFG